MKQKKNKKFYVDQTPLTNIALSNACKVNPHLADHLGYCLHKASVMMKLEIQEAFAEYNLQGVHFAVLSIIDKSEDPEGITQIKISEVTGIDKASLVKVIDHLESLKFIERIGSKTDRRVKNLITTKAGMKMVQIAKKKYQDLEVQFLSVLPKKDAESFKEMLLKILKHHQSLD